MSIISLCARAQKGEEEEEKYYIPPFDTIKNKSNKYQIFRINLGSFPSQTSTAVLIGKFSVRFDI